MGILKDHWLMPCLTLNMRERRVRHMAFLVLPRDASCIGIPVMKRHSLARCMVTNRQDYIPPLREGKLCAGVVVGHVCMRHVAQ